VYTMTDIFTEDNRILLMMKTLHSSDSTTGPQDASLKALEKRPWAFGHKFQLRCQACNWESSYTDFSGSLGISKKQIRCPGCKNGSVEIIDAISHTSECVNISRRCLEFVLTDW